MNKADREDSVTLEILEAIDGREGVTQRHLSKRLGVALGLTNSYLKRCAQKGLIKVKQAPANRYLYYITPKGFSEKSRLTAKYLSYSLDFYRKAGASCARVYETCAGNGWNTVVLCGVSDLAEIAALKALEYGVDVVGAYDAGCDKESFLNKPIWRKLPKDLECDLFVLTALDDPHKRVAKLVKEVGRERVIIPDILAVPVDGGKELILPT